MHDITTCMTGRRGQHAVADAAIRRAKKEAKSQKKKEAKKKKGGFGTPPDVTFVMLMSGVVTSMTVIR